MGGVSDDGNIDIIVGNCDETKQILVNNGDDTFIDSDVSGGNMLTSELHWVT